MVLITVIVPTFGRAGRMAAVAADIHDHTAAAHEVLFVTEDDDRESCAAAAGLAQAGAARWVRNERSRNYAGAVNTGARHAAGDMLFTGADDLRFHPGWDMAALAVMRPPVRVAGTNDLGNPDVLAGQHATHYLIDRAYTDGPGGVADGPPGMVLFEGYDHNWTDTEFIATARHRGVFAACPEAVVEHMHPVHGKGEPDPTYAKGSARHREDGEIFHSREHLWAGDWAAQTAWGGQKDRWAR